MKLKTRKRIAEVNKRARSLRRGDNMAEAVLWNELKGRKLGGYKFVRQFPIGPFFADFLCREKRLVVEVDGSQHADSEYDRRRDAFMRAEGYSVFRFWNTDALKELKSVCETILAALEGRLSEDIVEGDLRFVYAAPFIPTVAQAAISPHRLATLATSPQRGEETGARVVP